MVGLTIISTYFGHFANSLWELISVLESVKCNITLFISIILGLLTIVLFIITALIAFKSINPRSSPAKHVLLGQSQPIVPFYLYKIEPALTIKDWLYERINSKLSHNIEEIADLYNNADEKQIIEALSFELAKISYIREKKIFRVNISIKIFAYGLISWLISLILFKSFTY